MTMASKRFANTLTGLLALLSVALTGCAGEPTPVAATAPAFVPAGDAAAERQLAYAYLNGKGVAPSDAEALTRFRWATAQGDVPALVGLGWMYETGRGTAEDDAEAARLYRPA